MLYNAHISPSGGPPARTLLSSFPAPLVSLMLSEEVKIHMSGLFKTNT